MGMRSEENFNKIEVRLGSSENQRVAMIRTVEPKTALYRRDSRYEDNTNLSSDWTKDDCDNPDLLEKIIKSVKSDFVKKCISILETCTSMPDSLYTYDVFDTMFCFTQKGDCTTSSDKEVYKFLISDSEDIDDIVRRILVGYLKRNAKYASGTSEESDLVIRELVYGTNTEDTKEDLVRRMFGGGEFPFLSVKYAWHDGREEWHYAYSITR